MFMLSDKRVSVSCASPHARSSCHEGPKKFYGVFRNKWTIKNMTNIVGFLHNSIDMVLTRNSSVAEYSEQTKHLFMVSLKEKSNGQEESKEEGS